MKMLLIKKLKKQLISILRELKPDVVHCHLNAKCGIISKCASKAGVKKIISHCHAKLKFKGNIVKSALSYAELFWQKRLIKKHSTDFWGCSKEAQESLFNKKTRRSDKCNVISNLIDANRFIYPNEELIKLNKEKFNPSSKFAIGLIGRIAPVKNYLFAIEVAKELKTRKKDFVMLEVLNRVAKYNTVKFISLMLKD